MKTYLLHLPLFIPLSDKKNFSLNLNVYRNGHFYELNKAKETFHKYIGQLLEGIPELQRIMVIYTLFVGTKRRVDISNICSIVDKFFCDTLTEKKVIPDDSYDVLQEVIYRFGGFDKENPRVEALIVDLDSLSNHEETQMRITLDHSEIEEAIEHYIRSKVRVSENDEISVDLKTKTSGYSATIDIHSPKSTLENPSETVKSPEVMTEEEVFPAPQGTALQMENSAQQQVAETARSTAPAAKPEVTPPLSAEPAPTPSPAAPAPTQSAPAPQQQAQATQEAPSSVVAPKSLFAHLKPPVPEVVKEH